MTQYIEHSTILQEQDHRIALGRTRLQDTRGTEISSEAAYTETPYAELDTHYTPDSVSASGV